MLKWPSEKYYNSHALTFIYVLLNVLNGRSLGATCGPFTNTFNLIPAWINNYILYKVWDEITYPFLNFNGATVEV